MSDLSQYKARIDEAKSLAELAHIDACASADRIERCWTDAAWSDFDAYRQAKAIDLVQHSAAGVP